MAKRSKDREVIRMVKTLSGLSPCTPYDAERLAQYGFGREVDVTIWQERSVPHHRLYWVLLGNLVANSEGKYLQSTDMHAALKIALGLTTKIKLLTPSPHATIATRIRRRLAQCVMWLGGLSVLHNIPFSYKVIDAINDTMRDLTELETDCDTITMPGSTAFDSMDQATFKIYFDQACAQLRAAGYPVDATLAESVKMISSNAPKVTTSQHIPFNAERGENVPKPEAITESGSSETDSDRDEGYSGPF